MIEWTSGEKVQFPGGKGVILTVESTGETSVLTVAADDGFLRWLKGGLACVKRL